MILIEQAELSYKRQFGGEDLQLNLYRDVVQKTWVQGYVQGWTAYENKLKIEQAKKEEQERIERIQSDGFSMG